MYLVKVFVTYKKSILDPAGTAVQKVINQMVDNTVDNLRLDKYITFSITSDAAEIDNKITVICNDILINPNIEEYRYEYEILEANK